MKLSLLNNPGEAIPTDGCGIARVFRERPGAQPTIVATVYGPTYREAIALATQFAGLPELMNAAAEVLTRPDTPERRERLRRALEAAERPR